MKTLIAALLVFGNVASALGQTVTLTFQAGALSETRRMPAAAMTRLQAAIAAAAVARGDPTPTNAQGFDQLVDHWMAEAIGIARRAEEKAARDAVPSIAVTR